MHFRAAYDFEGGQINHFKAKQLLTQHILHIHIYILKHKYYNILKHENYYLIANNNNNNIF